MEPSLNSIGVFALLGLGLIFGLKHATEVDHVVAVSAIVSEHRNVFRSALVGALWGAGHTVSLVIVGVLVLVFRVAIPAHVASWLEFGVALMIITLGVIAIVRVLRKRSDVHLHRHTHDGQSHVHVHFHERGTEHLSGASAASSQTSHSHAISQLGFKPLLVGMMHGLAGSAALTLLVLTQIQSVWLGLLYLALFGVGSTLGMLLMSGLIGLPFALSSGKLTRINYGLQTAAGGLSVVFGLWYAYETAVMNGLWRTIL
jgi:ABC-type nickel/cobalt efflux system permease component RcnA